MRYELSALPESIRIQVQDYIEFLLAKYQVKEADHTPEKPSVSSTSFVEKWAGFMEGSNIEEAKYDYLTKKHQ